MRFREYLTEGNLVDYAKDEKWDPEFWEGDMLIDAWEPHKLTSLKGCPKKIQHDFNCDENMLKSLKYGPISVGGYYSCSENSAITSLDGIARNIGTHLYIQYLPKLTSLKDIHKKIDKMYGKICINSLNVPLRTQIMSHVLGVLLINGCAYVEALEPWANIVNKHLGKGRQGVMDAQTELIEAGLEEYAQL